MAANNLAAALTPNLPRVDGGVGINSYRMRRMPSHREKVIGHLKVFSKATKTCSICENLLAHTPNAWNCTLGLQC